MTINKKPIAIPAQSEPTPLAAPTRNPVSAATTVANIQAIGKPLFARARPAMHWPARSRPRPPDPMRLLSRVFGRRVPFRR